MHGPADKAAQDRKILTSLKKIKYPILVMSGKGGVGKSTVSTNLAFALALSGARVGLMDVDVHGPNIPKMLGIEDRQFGGSDEKLEPVEVPPGIKVASLALAGFHPDQAIIWRGPMKIAMIRQFLADVDWGELDYLVIDTPPGTGDEVLSIAQEIPNMAGAVVVTTPQGVSVLDSRKSITFAQKLNLPVLGIVENMSGFVCPCCQTITRIFKSGGGREIATTMGIPFLGEVPLEPAVVEAGDAGTPLVQAHPESISGKALREIASRVTAEISRLESSGTYRKAQANPDFRPER